jgi:hypothetical protein
MGVLQREFVVISDPQRPCHIDLSFSLLRNLSNFFLGGGKEICQIEA